MRSTDQQEAFTGVCSRLRRGLTTSLGGYAGTGKSTLLKMIYDELSPEGRIETITATGKAASVLQKKGVPARTVHSFLYSFHGYNEADEPIFKGKHKVDRPRWLFVDEASMITDDMQQQIEKHDICTFYVGDPGQLPPVKSSKFEPIADPTFLLTKIHRQCVGNPIIEFAHAIRSGSCSIEDDFPGIHHVDGLTMTGLEIARFCVSHEVDQMITATNARRLLLNDSVRSIYGRDWPLVVQDRLICLRNNYDYGVLNGQQFEVFEIKSSNSMTYSVVLVDDEKKKLVIDIDRNQLGNGTLASNEDAVGALFDYGYAVTCHKFQGSSSPHVAVVGARKGDVEWQYTAVTRAEKDLTIFR